MRSVTQHPPKNRGKPYLARDSACDISIGRVNRWEAGISAGHPGLRERRKVISAGRVTKRRSKNSLLTCHEGNFSIKKGKE